MRKLLYCVALLVLTNAPAPGQSAADAQPAPTPGDAQAVRLLRSLDNRERAWGAFLIGAHGSKQHAPLLVGLLENPGLAADGWEEGVVRQAVLDALIRLDAEVPAERLLPLYESSPDEVIILLARAPKQHARELLGLFQEEAADARWAAVGNLLTEARAKGFAARLLAGLRHTASVYVYDREEERGYNGGGGHGVGAGCGAILNVPEGFPPVGYYSLSTTEARGAVVFAPGRHTVFYVRRPAPDGCRGRSDGWVERDDRRVEYLAEMLGTTEEELGLEPRSFHEVICKNERQCGRALAALRDGIAGVHARAVERLLAAELLDPEEAARLKPDIAFKINDSRDGRSFPLPSKLEGVKMMFYGADADEQR